jgi:hypothetical protein
MGSNKVSTLDITTLLFFPAKKKITLPKVCVKMQFVINSKSNCPAK